MREHRGIIGGSLLTFTCTAWVGSALAVASKQTHFLNPIVLFLFVAGGLCGVVAVMAFSGHAPFAEPRAARSDPNAIAAAVLARADSITQFRAEAKARGDELFSFWREREKLRPSDSRRQTRYDEKTARLYYERFGISALQLVQRAKTLKLIDVGVDGSMADATHDGILKLAQRLRSL